MSVIIPILEPKARIADLLGAAVAAHANIVQLRLEEEGAVMEIMAAGQVVSREVWPRESCAQLLPAAFALCDGVDDYSYDTSRSAKMTGEKLPLPKGVAMVFVQFFPARPGQRHLVARVTYDADTCCGTCGG